MRNEIILNGISSSTVIGLLIQTQPPISKPQLRTQTDVIDGRDGDIVTPLGYAAYDKQFTIGLYGAFDIDRVIEFFSGSGTVIFSDEPDKVYRYAIYDEIDYEKLIRYRTATVTMHVQPFKYSASEGTVTHKNQMLTFNDTIKTQDGVSASIVSGSLTVTGTATQQTAIYLPIPAVEVPVGRYVVRAYAEGTAEGLTVQLIKDLPSSAFGTPLTVHPGEVTSMLASMESYTHTYNYLYMIVQPGEINVRIVLQLTGAVAEAFRIRNNGNVISKPQLTVYGCGDVGIELNGSQIFAIRLGGDGMITLDAETMNAYLGTVLKNRSVAGDYADLAMPRGWNTITFSGMVTQLDIVNYSRWI